MFTVSSAYCVKQSLPELTEERSLARDKTSDSGTPSLTLRCYGAELNHRLQILLSGGRAHWLAIADYRI